MEDNQDIAMMMVHGYDLALMDPSTRMLFQQVYAALPEPPVRHAAPLSPAAAASAPDGVDRISRLPAEVLRRVVSRLPAKDAARTTVLSRRWRRVWHTTPLVLVDAHLLPAHAHAAGVARLLQALAPGSSNVAAAVSRALAAHPGPFRFVHLTGTLMDAHQAELVRWLQLLAAKGVQELVLVNRARTMESDLRLPATLFRCTALTRLYIGFWRFPDTATLPRNAAFPYLQELGLGSLVMDERDLAFLLDKCPVLEKLILVGSRWPVCIRVQSRSLRCVEVCTAIVPEISVVHASQLERLLLWEAWGDGGITNMSSKIKIGHAPKLRFLGFLVPGMHELQIGNTIIKVGTRASPNTTVPSVQMLAIQVKLGSHIEARMLPSFLRCFPNIETLYVQSENPEIPFWGPQSSSSSTGKLNLKFWKEAGSIECVQRHIKKLVLREFRGNRCELDFLKFIAERAQVLEEMVIIMTHGYSPSDQVGTKLKTFLASAKWANGRCKLMVFKSPFHVECHPWCYLRAFDLSNKDPFDCSKCLEGKCLSH
ncbi:hypothetical protein ACP70R_015641 [Stipagrostis hirtigluma subsp. patula]